MPQIHAYLVFKGNCKEAMTFYRECLGGKLDMIKVGESPMRDQFPTSEAGQVLHAALFTDEMMLMGSDMSGPGELVHGNAMALTLTCNDREEMARFYENLAKGGKITHPIHDFFAGTFGGITDRYGNPWMLYLKEEHYI